MTVPTVPLTDTDMHFVLVVFTHATINPVSFLLTGSYKGDEVQGSIKATGLGVAIVNLLTDALELDSVLNYEGHVNYITLVCILEPEISCWQDHIRVTISLQDGLLNYHTRIAWSSRARRAGKVARPTL